MAHTASKKHHVQDSVKIANRVKKLKDLLSPVETQPLQPITQRSHVLLRQQPSSPRNLISGKREDTAGSERIITSINALNNNINILKDFKIPEISTSRSVLPVDRCLTEKSLINALLIDDDIQSQCNSNRLLQSHDFSMINNSRQVSLAKLSISSPRDLIHLTPSNKAPRAEKCDLRSLQNMRLNQMRQEIRQKVWQRREEKEEEASLANPVSSSSDLQMLKVSMDDQRMKVDEPIGSEDNNSPESRSRRREHLFEPLQVRKSSVIRQSASNIIRAAMIEQAEMPALREDQKKYALRINSSNQAEYNTPISNLRPIKHAELPLMIDHVGPGRLQPLSINVQPKTTTASTTKVASFKKDFDKKEKVVNFDTNVKSEQKLPNHILSASSSSIISQKNQQLLKSPPTKKQSFQTNPLRQASHDRRKNYKRQLEVNLDSYGAAQDATQPQQVNAIVQYFGRLFNTGNFSAQPSKPKPRVENPRVARGSDRKLYDVLSEYLASLEGLIKESDEAKAKQHENVYLGHYDANSIKMYEEFDKLRKMLEKAKQRMIDEQMEASSVGFFKIGSNAQKIMIKEKKRQKDQVAIEDIVEKIQHVLERIASRGSGGPNMSEKLLSFVSVEQTLQIAHPDHLPDIQSVGAKLLAENLQVAKRDNNRSLIKRRLSSLRVRSICDQQKDPDSVTGKEPLSNFFKPYGGSQIVVFPEQARIQNKSLQIYRYEVGEGLVDAISHRIKKTRDPDEILNELILDQNNLSDVDLARILDSLLYQGENYRQSCQSINISGNEVGQLALKSLLRFFEFQSPDHLCDLRLSNLRMPDILITNLFDTLSINVNLLKLSLANTSLLGCTAMEQLCQFLSHNDLLTEVNFSFCQLSIEQLTQVFSSLRGAISLTHLNVAFNFNDYGRYLAVSKVLFDTMTDYFESHAKLIHLDLSGLNLGENVLMLGLPLFKANSLQSVHFHGNNIREETRQELYDIFRIRQGVRQTKTQILASLEESKKSPSKLVQNQVVAEECKVDMREIEHKMSELKRDSMRLEATQFHGVGRRPEAPDKLQLIRILGHQELNLFHQNNVAGWQVSPTDACYICEGWKYTIFFYDRRRHIKNKLLDCVTRWILERFNHYLQSDHKRRIAPIMTAPTLIPLTAGGQFQLSMSNTLEFVARMNRTVCYLLEQAQINASRKQCPYSILLKCYLQNKVNVADNIALSMDLDVNDLIYKSLLYPEDSEIIDLPEQSNYFSREMEDDQTFVWAGFAKPGKHTVTIQDPLNLDGVVKQTFLVGVRKNELLKAQAPQLESIEEINNQGASRLDSTILFSNWKRDKVSLFDQCFKFDWSMINDESIQNMTSDEDQLEEVEKLIKSGYPDFIKAYSILASHSQAYPLIDKPRFEVFVNKCHMLSGTLQIETCFKIFNRIGEGKDLDRPRFLRAVLYLVHAKYLRPKAQQYMQQMIKRLSSSGAVKLPSDFTISDIATGVRHFFDKLIPKFSQKRTWQEFRVIVQKPKTSQILINSMTELRRCYAQWSEIANNKRRFTIDHSIQLFDYIKHVTKKHPLGKSIVISNQQLMACWGLSKITVKDLHRDFDRTQHMVFVEFLEFLCRVAHIAQFVECKPNYGGSFSSAGEDEATFKKPALSQSSDREDARDANDLQKALNYDSESSEDADFVPTDQNASELQLFTFLFHRSSMKVGLMGKKHRLKLRWLLSLIPAVLRKTAKMKHKQKYQKLQRRQTLRLNQLKNSST